MAEKRKEKKLLVILVVLVTLSLIVDLLYLNALYNISKNNGGLMGELATFNLGSCLEDCVEEEANCWGSDLHCSEEFARCEDDCYDQNSHYTPTPSPSYPSEPWYIESTFPYSPDYKESGVG